MTFEGEHRQIPIRGIERLSAPGVVQDGGMDEAINLIPRGGSYVPYSPSSITKDFTPNAGARIIRVHHTSTGDNVIIAYDNNYTINGVSKPGKVRNIVFIGNRMDLEIGEVVNGEVQYRIEHWLWKNGAYENNDDLYSHSGNVSVLPNVKLKVERGIYDGKDIYPAARYIRLHKDYTEASTKKAAQEDAASYVRNAGSVGSDASCLLDSVKNMGGITGYVLAAAAYRRKGSTPTNPQYIMASPIMLMGSMEKAEHSTGTPAAESSENFFYDFMLESMWKHQIGRHGSKEDFKTIWELKDSDDREIKDLSEKEHLTIEPIPFVTRPGTATQEDPDPDDVIEPERSIDIWKYVQGEDTETTVGGGGDDGEGTVTEPVTVTVAGDFTRDSRYGDNQLVVEKIAIWNAGALTDSPREHRGIRVSQCSANYLSFRVDGSVLEHYKDEIDRLCIFISPVVSPYKHVDAMGVRFKSNLSLDGDEHTKYVDFYNSDSYVAAGSFTPVLKSTAEVKEELHNIVGLYKVKEVVLGDIEPNTWVKVDLSGGKLDTDKLVQHSDTMLKISDMMPVGFTEGHLFGYNERLHVYNFRKNEVFRLPYVSSTEDDAQTDEYAIEVTDSNNSRIVTTFRGGETINPIVCCPDVDAKKVRVVRRRDEGQGVYYIGADEYDTKELAAIASAYISNDLEPIEITLSDEPVTQEEYEAAFNADDIKPDSTSYGKNEIRVSETGTILFETDKSYKVGHGEVMALARLSIGLSQDNFSKFPLVIFCTDGIYTLGVDASGEHAYNEQSPISRAVCTNVNCICELDGAVLFPTKYGLMLITMDGAKPVVAQAIGTPISPTDAKPMGLETYLGAVNHNKLVQLKNALSQEDFLDYIQDSASFARYLHALNSVIIYNSTKNYSYVIELSAFAVTKLNGKVHYDDGDYPNQTFWVEYTNGFRVPMLFDFYCSFKGSQVMFATRPIIVENQQLKSAYRFVLRGTFDSGVGQDPYAGMYVYGGFDGEHWDYLNGIEKPLKNNRFHDIGVETHRVSYKYFMVLFVGNLSKDSHIDGLEMTSNTKYINKLK